MTSYQEAQEVIQWVNENLTENTKKASTTYHLPAGSKNGGRFTSKQNAGSRSYGVDGGAMQMVDTKSGGKAPRMTKVACGAEYTETGSGGRGKEKWKCSTKEPTYSKVKKKNTNEDLEHQIDEPDHHEKENVLLHKMADQEAEISNQSDTHHTLKEEDQIDSALASLKAEKKRLTIEKAKIRNEKSKHRERYDRQLDNIERQYNSVQAKIEVLNNRKLALKEEKQRFGKMVQWSVS
jgi:hypothetical protein